MPTVVRSFPQINRSGTQQTTYVDPPQTVTSMRLQGQAADATLTDPLNSILFVVLASATGSDADAKVIQSEEWSGGFNEIPKGSGTLVPRAIDVAFGPIPAGKIALRATFKDAVTGADRTINVGATLTTLP